MPFQFTFFSLLTFIYFRRLITFIMLLLQAQSLSKKLKKLYWSEYLYCRWSLLFALVDRIQCLQFKFRYSLTETMPFLKKSLALNADKFPCKNTTVVFVVCFV